MNFLCWLWPLISGIICGILGYLLGKRLVSTWQTKYDNLNTEFEASKKNITQLEAELKACRNKNSNIDTDGFKTRISDLEAQLDTCNKEKTSLKANLDNSKTNVLGEDEWKLKLSNLQSDLMNSKSQFADLEINLGTKDKRIADLEAELKACKDVNNVVAEPIVPVIDFDADAAKAVFGKKIKLDDLKVVEGIGPKIEGLFHEHGIKTWKTLSEASVEKCQEVLNSGGERYRIHNPRTWPQQAKFAYEGKWADLLKWQDELNGGK